MSGWHHSNTKWRPKNCAVCAISFTPKSGINKFCSPVCKGKYKYITGKVNTASQYKEITGNWKRYASRLITSAKRKRDSLTREIILDLLDKQKYKCAISGEPLTCYLNKGKLINTNASVDQIVPNGGYTSNNIQIVQRVFNTMKWDQTEQEFIQNCKKVIKYYDEKKNS